MSKESAPFNEYVKKAHKTESFGKMMKMFEKFGAIASGVMGVLNAAKNMDIGALMSSLKGFGLDIDTSLLDKFAKYSDLQSAFNDLYNLGKGQFDKLLGGLDGKLRGLLGDSLMENPFFGEMYGLVKNYTDSLTNEWLSGLKSALKSFIPEDAFLWKIKGLYYVGSDATYKNTLRTVCLHKDLVVTLDWLDSVTGVTYEINNKYANDAFIAARHGAYKCATYIMMKLKDDYEASVRFEKLNGMTKNESENKLFSLKLYFAQVIRDIIVYSYDNLDVTHNHIRYAMIDAHNIRYCRDVKEILQEFKTYFKPSMNGDNDFEICKRAIFTEKNIDIMAPFYYFGGQKFFEYENSIEDKYDNPLENYDKGKVLVGGGKDTIDIGFRKTRNKGTLKHIHEDSLFGQIDKMGKKVSDLATVKQKVYINPRNTNIKKIYLCLSDIFNFNLSDKERLIHKKLHDRLKYPIVTPEIKKLNEAMERGSNGPFHMYMNTKTDNLRRMIHEYVKSIESTLFDPSQANWVMYDFTEIPDFRAYNEKNIINDIQNGSSKKDKKLKLPQYFLNNGLELNDFKLFSLNLEVLPDGTTKITDNPEDIAKISLGIQKKNNKLIYAKIVRHKEIDVEKSLLIGKIVYKERAFLLYYSEKYKTLISNDSFKEDCKNIEKYLIVKYLIDEFINKNKINGLPTNISDISKMYPSISESGLLSLFVDYIKKSNQSEKTNFPPPNPDINVGFIVGNEYIEYSTLPFYKSINQNNKYLWKIENSGVLKYNMFGVVESRYLNMTFDGIPTGIAIKNGNVFVISLNNDACSIYLLKENVFLKLSDNVNSTNIRIYSGTGIADISQISFYNNFYYDGKVFTCEPNKGISVKDTSSDTVTYINISNGLPSNNIKGLAFMPNGNMYLISEEGAYQIKNWNEPVLNIEKISDYEKDSYDIISNGMGSILTIAEPNPSHIEDFDIDDTSIIKSLMKRYSTERTNVLLLVTVKGEGRLKNHLDEIGNYTISDFYKNLIS